MSFLKKFFGLSQSIKSSENQSKYNNLNVLNPKPIEERFIKHFLNNGGKFLYCENLMDLKLQFLNILEENDWFECDVLCNEKELFSILDENKLKYISPEKPKFLFATCENLITDEGSILFSSNQIKQHKPNELPVNIIIFASINQIIETKSDGLKSIKIKYKSEYPTNITTIKYFEEAKEQDFLNYGSTPKNLYLLLLEYL